MDFDHDLNRMCDDWYGGTDQERALATSTAVLRRMRDGHLDPVDSPETLDTSVTIQFDAERGKPTLALETLRAVMPAYRHAEAFDADDLVARLGLRCQPQDWMARTFHVLGGEYARAALEHSYANLVFLMDVAGGPHALAEVLRRATASPVAEHAVAATATFMATIRPGGLDEVTRDRLLEQCRALARAHLLEGEGDEPVVYRRSDAFGAQGFFLFRALGDRDDADLVEALYRCSQRTRPVHARAEATWALPEVEWARFTGDDLAAERYRLQAIANLERFRLRRHQRVIAQRGYLAA